MSDTVFCVAIDGFKWEDPILRRSVLISAGQEMRLSPQEFDRLHGLGAVDRPEAVRRQIQQAEDAYRKEQEDLQAKAQQEWEERKAQQLAERLRADEAKALKEVERHERAVATARAKTKKQTDKQAG